jgi:hypothetical protein
MVMVSARHAVMRIIVTALLALAATSCSGELSGEPASLNGWGVTRWGMTVSEVLATDARVARVDPPLKYSGSAQAPLAIQDLAVQGIKMTARFVFASGAESAPLVAVNIESTTKSAATATERGIIERALIEKYGEPTHRGQRASGILSTTWALHGTTIRLTHINVGDTNLLVLAYQQRLDDPNL